MFGVGSGVRWAALARGQRLQAILNGTDLIPEVMRTNPGVRVYLLGGHQDLIVAAARRFPELFPGATLVGWHNGYFDMRSSAAVITEINEAKPELLLVGFGNPLQEQWVVENRDALDVPLSAAVGGLFAYWAGTLQRAPSLYRKTGFEWLHIMLKQPRKFRRYMLGNPIFLLRMVRWIRSDLAARAKRAVAAQSHLMTVMLGALSAL